MGACSSRCPYTTERIVSAGQIAWRVAEFWSSANPKERVLMLAQGGDINAWVKRSDFIRWVDSTPVQTQGVAASELAAYQYWAASQIEPLTLVGAWQARAALDQAKPVAREPFAYISHDAVRALGKVGKGMVIPKSFVLRVTPSGSTTTPIYLEPPAAPAQGLTDAKDAALYRAMKERDCTSEYCDYTNARLNGAPHIGLDAAIERMTGNTGGECVK